MVSFCGQILKPSETAKLQPSVCSECIPWHEHLPRATTVKRLLLFISIFTMTLGGLAQNPELDSLSKRMRETPEVKLFECEMCEAFARYTMLDSARQCLGQSRAKKTPSNEIKIRWELTDASVDIVTYHY